MSIDQQFVEFVIKSLVTKPEAVQIERRIDEKGVLLELTVDPEDLGRVIGKRGATAQSVRTLLRALGTKNDARYNLKIVDNGIGAVSSPVASASPSSPPSDDGWSSDDNTKEQSVADKEEDRDDEDEVTVAAPEKDNDSIARTRRELRDLDDLDV